MKETPPYTAFQLELFFKTWAHLKGSVPQVLATP